MATSKYISGNRNPENPVEISISNYFPFRIFTEKIDEVPLQFQKRDFSKKISIPARDKVAFKYFLRSVERGEYFFEKVKVYVSSKKNLKKYLIHAILTKPEDLTMNCEQ